jgi:hypothetical protein
MKFTTRAPAFDVEELFPFLRSRGKSAIRLHPRRKVNLPPDSSKFGGSIIWPRDEAFPEHPISGLKAVPLLQLRKQDVPEMPFPPSADLMQMLWFPVYGDSPLVFWRTLDSLTNTHLLEPSYPDRSRRFEFHESLAYIVHECAVHPERIIEYPNFFDELTESNLEAIENWEVTNGRLAHEHIYWSQLSTCPGSKVGGYPQWGWIDPWIPKNAEGQPLEFLMKFSDNEWEDEISRLRWQPIEDKNPNRYMQVIERESHREYEIIKTIKHGEPLTSDQEQALRVLSDPRSGIGTMLGHPMNIFLDRTVTPWQVVVDPPI